jgi:DNA-binding phage protein
MTTIQRKIREIIKQKKMSIYQVARGIGVDHANLYRSLRNGSNLELNTMMKVLDFLGYEIRLEKSSSKFKGKEVKSGKSKLERKGG